MFRFIVFITSCIIFLSPSYAQEDVKTYAAIDGYPFKGIKEGDKQDIFVMIDGQLLVAASFSFELFKEQMPIGTLNILYDKRSNRATINSSDLRKIENADSLDVKLYVYSQNAEIENELYHLEFPSHPERIEYLNVFIMHKNKRWRKRGKYSYIIDARYRNSIMQNNIGGGNYFKMKPLYYKVE